jgi:hypothetical protein
VETSQLVNDCHIGGPVLLAGAPLLDAGDSRYRSRIYRGMAITVSCPCAAGDVVGKGRRQNLRRHA